MCRNVRIFAKTYFKNVALGDSGGGEWGVLSLAKIGLKLYSELQWKLSEMKISELKNKLQKPLLERDMFPNYQDTLQCIPLISKDCEWSKFRFS